MVIMMGEETPRVPEELERYVDKPYGGILGDSVRIRIIEEIVADPYRDYRPKDFEKMFGASPPTIRRVLNDLTALGLLIKDSRDVQHPVYRPNLRSKKIIALTFLAYAVVDDRDQTKLMDEAIWDYYSKVLKEEFEPLAIATTLSYENTGRTWRGFSDIKSITEESCILAVAEA